MIMTALLNNPLFQSQRLSAGVARRGAWPSAMSCWQFLAIVTYPREQLGDTHPFERQRREELRAGNFIYRWFEPLVDEIAAHRRPAAIRSRWTDLQHNLIGQPREAALAAGGIPGHQMARSAHAGGIVLFLILWLAGWSTTAVVSGHRRRADLRLLDAQDRPRPGEKAAGSRFARGCRSRST